MLARHAVNDHLFASRTVPGKPEFDLLIRQKRRTGGPPGALGLPQDPVCGACRASITDCKRRRAWRQRRVRGRLSALRGRDPWDRCGSGRRQGSRWPPDQCDSVVFGVSSLHRPGLRDTLAGIWSATWGGRPCFPPSSARSLCTCPVHAAPWRAASRSGPKRRMADNCPRPAAGTSKVRICNVRRIGRPAMRAAEAARSSHAHRQPEVSGSWPADRIMLGVTGSIRL